MDKERTDMHVVVLGNEYLKGKPRPVREPYIGGTGREPEPQVSEGGAGEDRDHSEEAPYIILEQPEPAEEAQPVVEKPVEEESVLIVETPEPQKEEIAPVRKNYLGGFMEEACRLASPAVWLYDYFSYRLSAYLEKRRRKVYGWKKQSRHGARGGKYSQIKMV